MTDETTVTKDSVDADNLSLELAGIKKFYWEQIERLEKRIENHEGLIAILVQGYAELAANSEAALSVLSDNLETKDKVTEALKNSKEKFLEVLNGELNLAKE